MNFKNIFTVQCEHSVSFKWNASNKIRWKNGKGNKNNFLWNQDHYLPFWIDEQTLHKLINRFRIWLFHKIIRSSHNVPNIQQRLTLHWTSRQEIKILFIFGVFYGVEFWLQNNFLVNFFSLSKEFHLLRDDHQYKTIIIIKQNASDFVI